MLWTLIFDFYIQYIFGGIDSNADFYDAFVTLDGNDNGVFTSNIFFQHGLTYIDENSGDMLSLSLPLGNYLSLIATIITMIVILVLCAQLIKKIYNICAHVIA